MKQKNQGKLITMAVLWGFATFATFYLIYAISLWHDIENGLRLVSIVILLMILAALIVVSFKIILRKKKIAFIVYCFLQFLYILVIFFVAYNIHQVYSSIDGITKNYVVYSTSLVTINSDATKITNLSNGEIGIYNDEESIDGYQFPKEIIANEKLSNEVVYTESYFEIITMLDSGEITYAFLPTNFALMFIEIEEFSEIIEKIRIIYTEEKTIEKEKSERIVDLEKPITFLLMGIDSRDTDIATSAFNGDALMVFTFNPKTLNATILSIPRDTYVPIACFSGQRKNKITHAAWQGEKCMQETIEDFLDIEIDYVVKMNFSGLVKLVDLVGGVEVDVPYSFCEQDSRSRWGDNTVYVMEGLQKLNGEQALALTRNRKNNTSRCGFGSNVANDFIRGQNQQLVLRALLEEFKSIRNVSVIQSILSELSNMMRTNMETNEILAFYNVFKDVFFQASEESVADIVTIKKLYISGYDQYIHDYSQIHNQGTRSNLYNFVPYQGSLDEVIKAMKTNLEIIEWQRAESFAFDVNVPYQETVIGQGQYQETRIALLPDFSIYSVNGVETYVNGKGTSLKIEYVDNNGAYRSGQIISQFPRANTDLLYVNQITIEVAKAGILSPYTDCSSPNLPNCSFPNLVGLTYNDYRIISSKYNLNWIEVEIKQDDSRYDVEKEVQVFSQSVAVGTDIYTLHGQDIIIEYMGQYRENEGAE